MENGGQDMMDLTWYILGVLTGAVAYSLYLIFKKTTLNWLLWSGLMAGSSLILFSIAWGGRVCARGGAAGRQYGNTPFWVKRGYHSYVDRENDCLPQRQTAMISQEVSAFSF